MGRNKKTVVETVQEVEQEIEVVETVQERTFLTARPNSQGFSVNGTMHYFQGGRITTNNPDVIEHLVNNGFSEANVKV